MAAAQKRINPGNRSCRGSMIHVRRLEPHPLNGPPLRRFRPSQNNFRLVQNRLSVGGGGAIMTQAYIVDALRTAGGRRGGALKDWHPADLGAAVLDALVGQAGIDPAAIEDVIVGCVSQ